MKIFPAIDIINGECVRLTKGLAENKTIYDKSPVDMAKIYQDKGFETIHVVDLDATLGKGSNDKTLELIRKNIDIQIEVAGGIRDKAAIQKPLIQSANGAPGIRMEEAEHRNKTRVPSLTTFIFDGY